MSNFETKESHPVGEAKSGTSGAVVEACGGRLRVTWDDDAEVTAYGLLPFFSEFLKETEFVERWVSASPLTYTSNNAHAVRDVLGTIMLSLVSGQKRYSHITSLRADPVVPALFGMSTVVSEDSARRGLARIENEAGAKWMQACLREVSEELLQRPWILDIDTTIKPIYGHQEGAKLGYNPQKPGRPSHAYHSYIMANTRLILDVEVVPGNEHASLNAQPGLWRLIDELPEAKRPTLLRGDCAFGNESFMSGAEERNIQYLFKLRKSKGVKAVIRRAFRRSRWEDAGGGGWEGRIDSLTLQGWSNEPRVVVLRRKLKDDVVLQETATAQQQLAFIEEQDPIDSYEVAVLVTSLNEDVFALADLYRQRADAENIFDEIKNQWGWGGFTTYDIARCQMIARIGALVFNWWSVFAGMAFRDRHVGHEELPYVWESRFQHQYGCLRDEVTKTLTEYLSCGILAHGAARVYCDGCKHSLLVAFSCKRRGVCPSCGAKRAVKFAEHIYNEVIEDIPHRHTVFTIPKRLRVFFKYDRKLNTILFRAAWGTLSEVLGIDERELAAIFTVQTAGDALNFHPHLHGILADGYWKDGVFTRFPEIDTATLNQAFAERVLALLHKQELITDDVVAQVLSQEHTGCSVWMSEPFHDDDSERFVARYIERAPLSLEKLSIQHDIVIYTTKEGVTHEFDALEFLALLSAQVPAPYESLTRYFGRYSCRRRGERAKLSPPPAEEQESDYRQEFRKSSWAACIKRVYEIDPLECPKCKSQMRIIAFIQDQHSIKDIMKAQGIPDFQAPPPIPKFIDTLEAIDDLPSYDSFEPAPDDF